ncbi:solute carrier family 23 protein [Dethiobacter alkaliphilus]|uniref:Xanthine/uracil/vitamin C permease n=1 Tax=Dethiobacter alkaliphilus AHT 1 TaxID=555088 RepID=C0GCM9_DETAL|nr:solute carrier family 23 protein [Dethiobacter alkaliphilus]EEG78964.1 Xanthine/uracil/vitamin C permease [Dethiobacter alkaliphilus AHT 1]
MINRPDGAEQPFLQAGIFKIRVPGIHYQWSWPEFFQAMIMFVTSLGMIPLLTAHLGLPYEIALTYVFICGIGFMLPTFLGDPLVPGWITPAIPVVVLFLGNFEPGPEAIRALFALQFIVAFIFMFLGLTKLGGKLVELVPVSMKAGILIGAGIAAIMGEFEVGGNVGRLAATPYSIIAGTGVALYLIFSESFKEWRKSNKFAKALANYGMVPALVVAMFIGWMVSEYPLPDIQMGITNMAFSEYFNYLPFAVGFPGLDIFLFAVPTAIIAYIIAFGDIIVGHTLIRRADDFRQDEKIDLDINRTHIITSIRNFMHAFLAPYPGLAGPIWTAVTAVVAERYKFGRKAMDSIYSGAGTFWIAGFIALFILPLVSIFQPVLPIALSLTLMITGFLCIMVGTEIIESQAQRGVAGLMAVVLAVYGAGWGLLAGIALYFLIEKKYSAQEVEVTETQVEKNLNTQVQVSSSQSLGE